MNQAPVITEFGLQTSDVGGKCDTTSLSPTHIPYPHPPTQGGFNGVGFVYAVIT